MISQSISHAGLMKTKRNPTNNSRTRDEKESRIPVSEEWKPTWPVELISENPPLLKRHNGFKDSKLKKSDFQVKGSIFMKIKHI